MRRLIFLAALLWGASEAHGSTTRQMSADSVTNTTGGSALTVPSTGSALVTDSGSQTLTGKSISGSQNTLSNLPVGAQMVQDLFFGNGSATSLTLTAATTSTQATAMACYIDGLLLDQGIDYTFTTGSSTVTLTTALLTGQRARCVYSKY